MEGPGESGLLVNGGGRRSGEGERRSAISPRVFVSRGELGGAREASWMNVSRRDRGWERWASRTAASTSGETIGEAGYWRIGEEGVGS